MTLVEVLRDIEQWPEDGTLYVSRPWKGDSEVLIVEPAPDTTEPIIRDGSSYDYCLETFVAREFLEEYEGADSTAASAQARCERLISYAENDA